MVTEHFSMKHGPIQGLDKINSGVIRRLENGILQPPLC